MEDLIIRYDGTVRTAVGSIVQFLYGEDGMDGIRIEGQSLDHLKLDVSKVHIKAVMIPFVFPQEKLNLISSFKQALCIL